MADKGRTVELPQRVPGAARTGPASPVSPIALALPEDLRQRIRAAVTSELADGAADEQERAAEDRPGSAVEAQPEVWPGLGKPRRRVGGRLIALVLAVIVVGSLAVVALSHRSVSAAAVRGQAAVWVAGQVSRDVTVSCDPVMCAALQAQGFPAGQLVVLGPASPDPVPSAVVVETAAVRELFGSALATVWAPAVLASFGSGAGAVTVRVVAPQGAAAYQAGLSADLAGRQAAGGALLRASQVAVSAAARSQLLAGQVDVRLVLALVSVAGHEPVDIVRFGSLGPGAGPGVPLGFADLAESIPAAHRSEEHTSELQSPC